MYMIVIDKHEEVLLSKELLQRDTLIKNRNNSSFTYLSLFRFKKCVNATKNVTLKNYIFSLVFRKTNKNNKVVIKSVSETSGKHMF